MRSSRPRELPDDAARGELAAWLRAVDEQRLTRREFACRATALGVSLSSVGMLLSACGGATDDTATAAMGKKLPSQLVLYNWAQYISPKVLRDFEATNHLPVKQFLFPSNEACIAGVTKKPGAFDVLFPEEWASEVLRKAGLLYPLDMDLIPNFANVTQQFFRTPPYDPESDGHKYTVPYMFGTIGFAARLDRVPNPPDSWEVLFDAAYKKKISMLDGAREVLGPALFLDGSGPNTTDPTALQRAQQKAIEQKPLVTVYDSSDMTARIVKGLPLVECWDGDAIGAMKQVGLNKVRFVLPREGYIVWADALCVPRNAPSPYAAHLFLNYLLNTRVAAENANFTGYQPVIEAADPLIKSLVQRAMRPTNEQIENGTFVQDLGTFNASFDQAWEQVQKA